MYVPIYRKGELPDSVEARWQALRGFVYSPYRMGDLMQGSVGAHIFGIEFAIHDGSSSDQNALMYSSAEVDEGEVVRKTDMRIEFGSKHSRYFEYLQMAPLDEVVDGKVEVVGPGRHSLHGLAGIGEVHVHVDPAREDLFSFSVYLPRALHRPADLHDPPALDADVGPSGGRSADGCTAGRSPGPS